MKKISFFMCLFFAGVALAQETIVLPSSFDENQMIVKKMDSNGNYIPVDQLETPSIQQPEIKTAIKQGVQINRKNKTVRKRQNVHEKNDNTEMEELIAQGKNVRKLRAVEKDYGIQKTTFSDATHKNVEIPANTTFQMPTMTKAMDDFKKESISFEECDTDDPNCKIYELDENGQVIFK